MAKVLNTRYPFPKYDDYRDFDSYYKAACKALDEIPIDRLFTYPVADGKAFYFIKSMTPLVLQHIDYLDGYQCDPIFLRGLRREDMERFIAAERALIALFSKQRNEHE